MIRARATAPASQRRPMASYEIEQLEADSEGHSLLGVELARTMNQDRERATAKLVTTAPGRAARSTTKGGILSWFGRRSGRASKTDRPISDRVAPRGAP